MKIFQRLIAYENLKSKEIHIGQHDTDSKNVGVKINKAKAEYAKNCQALGLLRKNGSSHYYNSGFIVALMNSNVDDWVEHDLGVYDTSTIDIVREKKRIAQDYEDRGFKIITSVFKKSRSGEPSNKYTKWASISANKPWDQFKKMCHKIFYGSGVAPIEQLIREVYRMVIHPDAIDYTKADVRDFFVNKGLLPK